MLTSSKARQLIAAYKDSTINGILDEIERGCKNSGKSIYQFYYDISDCDVNRLRELGFEVTLETSKFKNGFQVKVV